MVFVFAFNMGSIIYIFDWDILGFMAGIGLLGVIDWRAGWEQ